MVGGLGPLVPTVISRDQVTHAFVNQATARLMILSLHPLPPHDMHSYTQWLVKYGPLTKAETAQRALDVDITQPADTTPDSPRRPSSDADNQQQPCSLCHSLTNQQQLFSYVNLELRRLPATGHHTAPNVNVAFE